MSHRKNRLVFIERLGARGRVTATDGENLVVDVSDGGSKKRELEVPQDEVEE